MVSKLTVAMCWGNPGLIPYKLHSYLLDKLNTAVLLCRISVIDGDFCYREKFFEEIFHVLDVFKECDVLNNSCYGDVKELFCNLKKCKSKTELEDFIKC